MQYKFRVMTFNVRRDTRLDGINRWYFRRGYAANSVVRLAPDIAGVQELMPHMKDYFCDALSDYKLIGRGRGKLNDNEHSDILLRRETVDEEDSHTFWLSSRPADAGSRILFTLFPRICTAVRARLKGANRSIYVLNTHFDFISRRVRMHEAEMICGYIREIIALERLPLILMGDFNTVASSPVIKRLCDNGTIPLHETYSGEKGTLHLFRGTETGMRCDHILVSDDFDVLASDIDTTFYHGRYPSDHFPMTADLGIDIYGYETQEE